MFGHNSKFWYTSSKYVSKYLSRIGNSLWAGKIAYELLPICLANNLTIWLEKVANKLINHKQKNWLWFSARKSLNQKFQSKQFVFYYSTKTAYYNSNLFQAVLNKHVGKRAPSWQSDGHYSFVDERLTVMQNLQIKCLQKSQDRTFRSAIWKESQPFRSKS